MMERKWHDVPGAPQAKVFPFIRKPDVVCSNAYVIHVPGQVIVIDPGAEAKQMSEILQLMRGIEDPEGHQVSFYLTHCHVDHCFSILRDTGFQLPEGSVMLAHTKGVEALRDGDTEVTQARVMGWDFPPVELQVELRSLLDDETLRNGQLMQSTQMQERDGANGEKISYQRIPIGTGTEMVVYHTPGHSPDSVVYQIGRLLFTGDLLFATDTGVVGIVGWDRDAMESSIRNVAWLLDEERIELCLPGHGHCIETAKAKHMLTRMLSEVHGLGNLKTKDAERIRFTSEYALDLLDEANENFSIIAGRLYYLAYHLEDLEEGAEARKYLDLLEGDRIDEMLTSFNRFVEEFHAGKKLQLEVTMKAVQTMKSINGIFKGSDLEAILDRSLISGTSRLLIDFMSAVKGIELDVDRGNWDLSTLLSEIVDDQAARPTDDLMDCLDDPVRYASALAKRIAHIPVFDEIEMTLEGSGSMVWLDRRRFQDAFSGVLLDLAGAEAKKILIRVDGSSFVIASDIALGPTMGEKKVRALSRRFELAGGELSVKNDSPWTCEIRCLMSKETDGS